MEGSSDDNGENRYELNMYFLFSRQHTTKYKTEITRKGQEGESLVPSRVSVGLRLQGGVPSTLPGRERPAVGCVFPPPQWRRVVEGLSRSPPTLPTRLPTADAPSPRWGLNLNGE